LFYVFQNPDKDHPQTADIGLHLVLDFTTVSGFCVWIMVA